MDREAWRAVIHGITKSWTRLTDWTELNNSTWWGITIPLQVSAHLHRWSFGNLSWVSSRFQEGEVTSPKGWMYFHRPTCSSCVGGANLLVVSGPYSIFPDTRGFYPPLAPFPPSLNETVTPGAVAAILGPCDSKQWGWKLACGDGGKDLCLWWHDWTAQSTPATPILGFLVI